MYIIELTLKHTPIPLSVQRKSPEDAEAVYKQVLAAMQQSNSPLLELTCERQTEKKVAVLCSEICAVQMAQKSSTGPTGKPPGFFAVAQ
ncbi:MAG: hypothetical protein NVS2B14_04090 [Chamaesiphon sp.]